ncbi:MULTISPECIES: ATP-binding cassette domain-containing protein [Lacticaseibacillus]|uniref:ATP-binding cassette domain-containing protein n=1 Tax=Lacticaseibacillus TaxID=2759736 RepID=UPI00063DD11B|nr:MULTISPECIES: ATP-binding cassette domain-containing protein [Lacticaseibacillus]KLI77082.1 ABC transporter ATP-binding protein [Lacticaseibacillus casei]
MLTVNNLDKWFGKKQALHQISFEIKPGRVVGLIGANGAGKTTIMKTILGISSFTGDVQLNDQKITVDSHDALKDVGALIEYPGLYPYLTGREQLYLFTRGTNRRAKVDKVIEEMRLTSYADSKAKHYSLGMKQKLGIALALVNQPSLVILDEPMNGLDPKATRELRELILQKKAEGISFLISSHILSELQKVADDVVIINHGHLVTSNTMSAVLARNESYLLLRTDQNDRAAQLLVQKGYQAIVEEGSVKIARNSIQNMTSLLRAVLDQNIAIHDIHEQQDDLENSLLGIIE